MKAILSLFALLLAAASAHAEGIKDYRARTVYFLLTDRFNPHTPYSPYVDPEYPDATNSVNCFVEVCTQEQQWRSYWGGDILGLTQKLDYLQDLGISAVWVTPLMENVRAYEGGTGYGTGYHGYWVQNYDRVNAHFGDWEAVGELSRELHAGACATSRISRSIIRTRSTITYSGASTDLSTPTKCWSTAMRTI